MEQRKTRRFKLQLPVSITRSGAERVAILGLTKNISSRGVLFTAETEPVLGRTIEYVITLNQDGPRAVNLHCIGTVVRAAPADSSLHDMAAFQIAATLERHELVRES